MAHQQSGIKVWCITLLLFILGESTHIPLKLPLNCQCTPKLPIVSIAPLKLLKNVNVPLIPTKRQK
jgi:hypothetical protein